MAVIVVVGGQFGSEGKGKVAHYFAKARRATVAIRVGGSNSGHTVIDAVGRKHVFRVLPTAAVLKDTICVLAAGSYIDVDVLLREIATSQLSRERLWIDPNAYIVSSEHKDQEASWDLGNKIGSTLSGTGAAVIDRVRRVSELNLAQYDQRLSPFVRPIRPFLRARLKQNENVIVEGTQGFGLSLLHSPHYPKVTSRDTTAAAFVAEAGLSPLDVSEVILVIRSFPIRVAGDSGPLPNQVDWETITREGNWLSPLMEFTSVTKKIRRVARFDADVVKDAIAVNSPTSIVLNHADYIDATCAGSEVVTSKVESFVKYVEQQIDAPISYLGLGPDSVIDRQPKKKIVNFRG